MAGLFIGILSAVLVWFVRRKKRKALLRALSTSLFLIRITRGKPAETSAQAENDRRAEMNYSEQLMINLMSLKQPFVFEVAVPHIGEEIHFYLSVPKQYSEIAIKQVHGFWPSASVSQVDDDYNIFNPHGVTVAAYLKQQKHFALPIRAYSEVGTDTFQPIVGALTKVNEIGEGAAIQVVCEPAPKFAKKTVLKILKDVKRGTPLEKLIRTGFGAFAGEFKDAMKEAVKNKETEKDKAQTVVDEDAAKALEMKLTKPFLSVNVRLLASAATPFQANDILEGLAAGFGQFGSPRRNEFKMVKPKNPSKLAHSYSYRLFDGSQSMILNSEEVVSFFHLPLSTSDTPKIKWLKAKEAPPPDNLPKEGCFVGDSSFRGQLKPVYITDEDRRRHAYVIGQTGTGKTTLFKSMIMDDISRGKGVCVIDPHGEFAEFALANVPKDRLEDVIYFDPGDLTRPLGLNMLDYNLDRPEEKTFIVNEMQSIFNKLFSQETMGPMFEQYMRNALLLLMEDLPNEPATLIEVPRIFTDAAFRNRKLERIHNPVVIDFWQKEATKAGGEASLNNMTPYITSKFNNFIANDYMRVIIGQEKSAFSFRDVMDSSKILLVNLSKGKIGDINANLLGMIIVGKLLMAALSRGDTPGGTSKPDFNLFIDEFQNFTTDSIATILSEARKYRLNLAIAHQFIAQLTEKIRDAVFGNVGNQIVMRVGPQDAEFLVKQFDPVFNHLDLVSIDNFNAFVKILCNGQTVRPFNIRISTRAWQLNAPKELMEKMKEYSRLKYGMDRELVEEGIFRRLRSGEEEDDLDDEEDDGDEDFASFFKRRTGDSEGNDGESDDLDEDLDKVEKDNDDVADGGAPKGEAVDGSDEDKEEQNEDEESLEGNKEQTIDADSEEEDSMEETEKEESENSENGEEKNIENKKDLKDEESESDELPGDDEDQEDLGELSGESDTLSEDEEAIEDSETQDEGETKLEEDDVQNKEDASDQPVADGENESDGLTEEEKREETSDEKEESIPEPPPAPRPPEAKRISQHSFGSHIKKQIADGK